MRKVVMSMGMPVSIDIPEATHQAVFDESFDFLRYVDKRFSTYRNDSEVNKFNRNEITKDQFSPDVLYVWNQCMRYSKKTAGYFTAFYNPAIFDPSGYVKTWAMEHVALVIESYGYTTYLINVAGDIIGHGNERTWNIAIQDPFQKTATLGTVTLLNQSIATSGSYERGAHIINPFAHNANTDLLSVTIYGKNSIEADVYATTCIAMGSERAIEFLSSHLSVAALLVKKDGTQLLVNDFQLVKMQTVQ